jgi:hypothetical protein
MCAIEMPILPMLRCAEFLDFVACSGSEMISSIHLISSADFFAKFKISTFCPTFSDIILKLLFRNDNLSLDLKIQHDNVNPNRDRDSGVHFEP